MKTISRLPDTHTMQARCLLTGPGLLGELQPRLNASGIHTAHDFYTRTTLDLVESLDVPYHVVQRLREQVAQLTAPPLVTVRGGGSLGKPVEG